MSSIFLPRKAKLCDFTKEAKIFRQIFCFYSLQTEKIWGIVYLVKIVSI